MSHKQVFAIRDSKVGYFGPPMILRSTGEAIRVFTDACQDQKSQLSRHPEDFSLHLIGEYDEVKGQMIPQSHVSFGSGTSFIPRPVVDPAMSVKAPNGEVVDLNLAGVTK